MKKKYKCLNLDDYIFPGYEEITGDELFRINGGGRIQPEQNENPPEGDSSNNSDSYTVQSGDTLSQIVYDYNQANGTHLTVDEVAALSGIDNPDLILPGQDIIFGTSDTSGQTTDPAQTQSTDPAQTSQTNNPENYTSQGNPSSTAGFANLGYVSAATNENTATDVNIPTGFPDNSIKGYYDPNNPSKYIVDLDDRKSMEHAADLLAEPEHGIKVTAIGSKSGGYEEFKKYSEINDYLVNHKTASTNNVKEIEAQTLLEETSSVMGNVSTDTFLASEGLNKASTYVYDTAKVVKFEKYSKGLSYASSITGLGTVVIDSYSSYKKPTFNNFSNVLSDVSGLAPVAGPLYSLETKAITSLYSGTMQVFLGVESEYIKVERAKSYFDQKFDFGIDDDLKYRVLSFWNSNMKRFFSMGD